MPIPTTITPAATQVVFEIEDGVDYLTTPNRTIGFGTIVLRGSSATTYAVGDIVLANYCEFFQENTYRYAITDESNILLTYAVP